MCRTTSRHNKHSSKGFCVNSNCIDCGSCWQIAPEYFEHQAKSASIHKQPETKNEIQKAFLALIDCPVAAITAPKELTIGLSTNVFPIPITRHSSGNVFYCGWSSKKSFGASSWLICREEGNIIIDSPRWSAPLATRIKSMGGISHMVLTHRDDVADHSHWAKAFNCKRWIHIDDKEAAPEAEIQISGEGVVQIDQNVQIIPTPGHTKGSMVILLGNQKQILFSGDHLWWNPEKKVIVASKDFCWWNWNEQLKSVKKLSDFDIHWLLPGHGHAHHFEPKEWKKAVKQTLVYSANTLESQN